MVAKTLQIFCFNLSEILDCYYYRIIVLTYTIHILYVLMMSFLFQVLSDVPFICPSEVDQLNKLCKLGTYYRDFNNFIRQNGGHLSLQHNGKWNLILRGHVKPPPTNSSTPISEKAMK